MQSLTFCSIDKKLYSSTNVKLLKFVEHLEEYDRVIKEHQHRVT